ncbi:hypothetical protein GCM10022286_03750 [Gryllotalpicola daejeonensis]|uniref:ParB/Sulfiredoxin domain-containing protein n=1 Tax=Gryllotalpicola daejeonensis TaxID=993087 RepID=A0ABP7ZEB4_9MICO
MAALEVAGDEIEWGDVEFTGSGARDAAAAGLIEEWVHAFMRGKGDNVPLSDGLALQQRWWLGPVAAPAHALRRKVGPEPGLPYPVSEAEWAESLPGYVGSIENGWDVPPSIVEYVGADQFPIADGSHRVEALRSLGRQAVEVVVWFNSEAEWRSFSAPWAHGAVRNAGRKVG